MLAFKDNKDFADWLKRPAEIGQALNNEKDFRAWLFSEKKSVSGEGEPEFSLSRLATQTGRAGAQGVADVMRSLQAVEEHRDIPAEIEVRPSSANPFYGLGATRRPAASTSPVERFRVREMEVEAEKEKGPLTPQDRKAIRLQYKEEERKGRIDRLQEFVDLAPVPLKGSSGIIEDAVVGMARFLPAMGISAVNPIAGTAVTFSQIFGMKYDECREGGVSKDRAFDSAVMSALAQTPVEMAGNLIQIGVLKNLARTFKIKGPGVKRLAEFGEAVGKGTVAEGGEEWIQQWLDEAANIYAANPDLNIKELAEEYTRRLPEIRERAGHSAAIGAVGGGLLGGSGGAFVFPLFPVL